MSRPANPVTVPLADYSPKHFLLAIVDGVATVTLNRPERKNPLTFESYRELTDFFRACAFDDQPAVEGNIRRQLEPARIDLHAVELGRAMRR